MIYVFLQIYFWIAMIGFPIALILLFLVDEKKIDDYEIGYDDGFGDGWDAAEKEVKESKP